MIDTTLIINFIRELFSLQTRLPLLFTSFYFWAFFALVFSGIALFGSKVLLRNTFLMFCGLFFYFKTSGFFVLVLIFAILLNYLCAKAITVARTERGGKVRLIIGLVVNILLLCY
ncbi:MAG: MBOAT family protein, partial [Bacteroidetes bacterium]